VNDNNILPDEQAPVAIESLQRQLKAARTRIANLKAETRWAWRSPADPASAALVG
jgi:hypothetical protein